MIAIPDMRLDPGLPPELQKAQRLFQVWSQERLLIEQDESTPREPLYHYTGEAAMRGILRHQKFWCFSHLDQSDPTEFEYSLAIARKTIRAVGAQADSVGGHFCACLGDMLETNWLAGPFGLYLFSLSRHRDHRPQWELYGHGSRGYAIGFAPSLFAPTQSELNEQANENVHVGRVIYGDAATISRHRSVIETAARITSKIARQHRTGDNGSAQRLPRRDGP